MTERMQESGGVTAREIAIDLAIMTAIGIALALIGPLGSFGNPLALRLLIWVGFAYLGYALYSPIDGVAQRLAPRLDLPVWSLRIAACLVASVPMAVAVWVVLRLPDRVRAPSADEALVQYLYVVLIGGLITVITTLIRSGSQGGASSGPARIASPAPASPCPAGARFLERLPPALGSELVALEMEDHYVRAHTLLGSELILMRMRDATSELEEIEGAQVHRSWWVARNAVEDVKRTGRNVRLVLTNGIEAPVARANVRTLRDAGWL